VHARWAVWPKKYYLDRTVRLSEAPSFGKSILEYDPNGTGARAYRALAAEFIRPSTLAQRRQDALALDRRKE